MDTLSFSKLAPDPHSLNKLDPDPHKVKADPKNWFESLNFPFSFFCTVPVLNRYYWC
jgi:hypothetical protein